MRSREEDSQTLQIDRLAAGRTKNKTGEDASLARDAQRCQMEGRFAFST